jgi:hypothetical protein
MDKALRNTLRSAVTQCRKLLEESLQEVLQGQFGIHADGKVEEDARMGHLAEEDLVYRAQLLAHLQHIRAGGFKPKEAVGQLVREVAFTHLNRLCAYKMMEKRGLIREAVSQGSQSQGFLFFLADHPQEEALWTGGNGNLSYRHFLEWLGDTYAKEIGVLFSSDDPANRLFPPQRVLEQVLALINGEDLKAIWTEDETIGWVYQYFTPKELRDTARKESSAPRNSYELAFRNQFFTPRYVVQFLTDNTLGRIWYEMQQGKTRLVDQCQYLVRRTNEVFLGAAEAPPAGLSDGSDGKTQEELLREPAYILHRPKKDPREIRMLDPAGGSGHFALYAFDLYETIYSEAWDDPDLGPALKADHPDREAFTKAVPGLILRHNIHLIDIDRRACQIAALALWLRVQRSYKALGLKPEARLPITRANIVCAEPMPGEKNLLEEFCADLEPPFLREVVRQVFESMRLAGEMGSLLKIEEEIRGAVAVAKAQWEREPKPRKVSLFPEARKPVQPELYDLSGITEAQFWEEAEGKILESLHSYAKGTSGEQRFSRNLFAEDVARGFGFVDLCRKRYDVVLMNPPFGVGVKEHFLRLKRDYPDGYVDLYASFVIRASQLCEGRMGAISSRSFLVAKKLERLRLNFILPCIDLLLDLGCPVMDEAMVQSCAYILNRDDNTLPETFVAFDRKQLPSQAENLLETTSFRHLEGVFCAERYQLSRIPKACMLYSLPKVVLNLLTTTEALGERVLIAKQGMKSFNDFRFLRLRHEVNPSVIGAGLEFEPLSKGGPYAVFYSDLPLLIRWQGDGALIAEENKRANGQTAQARQASIYYRKPGGTYSRRCKDFGVRVLPAGFIIGEKGPAIFPTGNYSPLFIIGLLNSRLINLLVHLQANAKQFDSGILERLPWKPPGEGVEEQISALTQEAIDLLRRQSARLETEALFLAPFSKLVPTSMTSFVRDAQAEALAVTGRVQDINQVISSIVDSIYSINSEEIRNIVTYSFEDVLDDDENASDEEAQEEGTRADNDSLLSMISYLVGCIMGRWDIRVAVGAKLPPEHPDPFAPLPVCSPGMLLSDSGLPLRDSPPGYPLIIDWDGILVDDPDHSDDIVRRVRDALAVMFKGCADSIEHEACQILAVQDVRDYFRKPGNEGFWMDHVKRYSKSRRKAPIYWLLQSSKKNYGLWLYYHRLDKDMLFKALVNYVEPKLRREEARLKELMGQRVAAGTSGREAKGLEKEVDRQEAFLSELRDFQDKLKRVAELHLDPDLSDGVILNIAPYWELVPWKEPKAYWEELLAGKYEWSSIGKQLREKGLIRE